MTKLFVWFHRKKIAGDIKSEINRIYNILKGFKDADFNYSTNRDSIKKFLHLFKKSSRYGNLVLEYENLPNLINELNLQIRKLKNDFKNIIDTNKINDIYLDKKESEKIIELLKKNVLEINFNNEETIKNFYSILCIKIKKIIDEHNEKFICQHLNDSIFKNVVCEKNLDKEQCRAILCEPKSNLVIAGAGTGKTLTICGKVKYLLNVKKVDPSKILILSYSKDSITTIQNRIEKISNKIKVNTFHSIGKQIIESVCGTELKVYTELQTFIENHFFNTLSNNRKLTNKVFKYFLFYFGNKDNSTQEDNLENELLEKINNCKTIDNFMKILDNIKNKNEYETLSGDIVRSKQEVVIANFLYLNGIKFNYEKEYKYTFNPENEWNYRPDFYLKDNLYIEHYGINEELKAPQYGPEGSKRYLQSIKWKRKTHKKYGTKCIETYSYEFSNDTVLTNLKKNLSRYGINILDEFSKEIVKETIEKIKLKEEFQSLINPFVGFLSLYLEKYSNDKQFCKFKKEIKKGNNGGIKINDINRANLFFSICKDIYQSYTAELRELNKIDFSTMILSSKNELENELKSHKGKIPDSFKFSYILVDEFQDISQSRLKLLQALIGFGDSKLFAVGDDWQAIYRFNGCDVNIFLKFCDEFEDAKINYILKTYRNSKQLHEVVTPFIRANNKQYQKEIISAAKDENNPIKLFFYDTDKKIWAFNNILFKIRRQIQYKKKNDKDYKPKILVLGRYNKDADFIPKNKDIFKKTGEIIYDKFPDLEMTFKTVHASKGLESDYVILVNVEKKHKGYNGFPCEIEDDELLNILLPKPLGGYEFDEERRLFYVALTRTRSIVYVLTSLQNTSTFIDEIRKKSTNIKKYFFYNNNN